MYMHESEAAPTQKKMNFEHVKCNCSSPISTFFVKEKENGEKWF